MDQNTIDVRFEAMTERFDDILADGDDENSYSFEYSSKTKNPYVNIEQTHYEKGKRKTVSTAFSCDPDCKLYKDNIGLFDADKIIRTHNDREFFDFGRKFVKAFEDDDVLDEIGDRLEVLADHIVDKNLTDDDHIVMAALVKYKMLDNMLDKGGKDTVELFSDYIETTEATYDNNVVPDDDFVYNRILHRHKDDTNVNNLSFSVIDKYIMYRDYMLDIEPSNKSTFDLELPENVEKRPEYIKKYDKFLSKSVSDYIGSHMKASEPEFKYYQDPKDPDSEPELVKISVDYDILKDLDSVSFSEDARPEQDKFIVCVGSSDSVGKYFVLDGGKKPIPLEDYEFDSVKYPAINYAKEVCDGDLSHFYKNVFGKATTYGSEPRPFCSFDEFEVSVFTQLYNGKDTQDDAFVVKVDGITKAYSDDYMKRGIKTSNESIFSNMDYTRNIIATGGRSDMFKLGDVAKSYVSVVNNIKNLSDLEKAKKNTALSNYVRSDTTFQSGHTQLYELLKLNAEELTDNRRSHQYVSSFRSKMHEVDSVKENVQSIEQALEGHEAFFEVARVYKYNVMHAGKKQRDPVSDYDKLTDDEKSNMTELINMATAVRSYNCCTYNQFLTAIPKYDEIYMPKSVAEMAYMSGLNRILHKDVDLNFMSTPSNTESFSGAIQHISKDVNSLLLSGVPNNKDFSLKVLKEDLQKFGEAFSKKYDGVTERHFEDLTQKVIKTCTNKVKEEFVSARMRNADKSSKKKSGPSVSD